jgi:hypothetical protein
MDNKKIVVSELDFDRIKANLKTFLQGQSEFSDYDFEGSALSVLLDLLAYNTHYNAVYTNLAVNEMFLDSARKRNSVVSLSKMLGYLPQSVTAPTATVDISVSGVSGNPVSLTLPAYSPFTTRVDNNQYNFYSRDAITVVPVSGVYTFNDVILTEGKPLNFTYTAGAGVQYKIPNIDVDTDTLTVRVQENSGSAAYTSYTFADNIAEVGPNTRAYFLKEIDDGLFEVYFGDGIVGYKPANGNVVSLNYFTTNKTAANGARTFTYNGSSLNGTISINTVSVADGGAESESIDSIKFNAPKNYSAQNRAVTAEDYKVILPQVFANVESVNVWGGEDNNPPIYGKVFICIKPKSGETLTNATKESIKNTILKGKNVVSIIPEVVDPQYLYIKLDTTVYYNPLSTNNTDETIKTLVRQIISDYNTSDLKRFDGMFRFSKLSRLIDTAEDSILSNISTLTLVRSITPSIGTGTSYVIRIENPIYSAGVPEDAVLSEGFIVDGTAETVYLEDDGVGNLRLFYYASANTKKYVNANQGTVDYTNGIITINDINITYANNNKLTFNIKPQSNDIVSVRSQLVMIAENQMAINAIADSVATGSSSGGTNYIFTSSRN